MLKVRVMTETDYEFAVDLANTMDWSMEQADFRFNQTLEPEGCLVLLNNTEPIGIATCISFGEIGWFGNLIVKPDQRKHGAGHLLLEHALNYLKGKGVETVGLYAYQHLKEFYGKSGFKADIDLAVMHNDSVYLGKQNPSNFEARPDFGALNRFDQRFFGADRSRLLKSIIEEETNICFTSIIGNEVNGYILAKVYDGAAEVGPLVCKPNDEKTAQGLLERALGELRGKHVSAYLPENQTGLFGFLEANGFKKDFSLSRMFLGSPKIQDCIYVAESLERG
jgi:GNAT superfamily N-acetyltransferase